MMIEWKELMYRNDILISNTGIIKNKRTGYVYKPSIKNGYLRISSMGDRSIHRLLAEHFIPNPNNYNTVNHINEDKLDNRIENLEWVTQKQNVNKFIENNKQTLKFKIVEMFTMNGEYIKSFNNVIEASRYVGITRSAISKCCNGNNKSAHGYIFKFKEQQEHVVAQDKMREIKNYNNYLISNDGKIYNKTRGRVLKHCKNANGNYYVSLVADGKKRNFYIHRLVYEAYCGDIPSKKKVIHDDGDKTNHNIKNLKLV